MKRPNKLTSYPIIFLILIIDIYANDQSFNVTYFPLHNGNQWYFQTIPADPNYSLTWSISDTVLLNNTIYFIFNGVPIRKDTTDSIWEYREEGDVLWLDFSPNGDSVYTYTDSYDNAWAVKVTKNLSSSTLLGELQNCIKFSFDLGVVDGQENYIFAPNIGPVEYWNAMNPYEIYQAKINGETFTHVSSKTKKPFKFELYQNYPNPFNHSTNISFFLYRDTFASVEIFDITGRKVETLIDRYLEASKHSIIWDASKYPTGQYSVRLKVEGYTKIIKVLYVK